MRPTSKKQLGNYALLALALTSASPVCLAKGPVIETPSNQGDFCAWLESKPGTLYKNSDNPLIQEIGIFGRVQYQQAWIDGESAGQDFWYDSEGQFRRARLGAQIKFLNLFTLKGNADMASDSRPSGGDLDWGYENIYEAQLAFNARKAFNLTCLDKLEIAYGKSEIKLTQESLTSSKSIKTIERSAIANKLMPTNLTGVWIDAQRGPFSYYLSVFSTVDDTEFASWNAGELFLGRVAYDFTESTSWDKAEAVAGFIYADNDGVMDTTIGFDWAASLAINLQQGRTHYTTNVVYGENRDDAKSSARRGDFWGLVFMPTYWVVENRVEAVLRYQYAHSSGAEGIRLNSRYARNAGDARQEDIATLRNGRGDEHHSIYLGLNYYFCKDNSKLMFGVEWDDISSDGNDVYNGITYGFAYRMFF